MLRIDDQLVYSATDLVGFLECGHLANLERAAVWGNLDRPMHPDPVLDRIAQRGEQHEARFLTFLQHLAIITAVLLPIVIFTLGAYLICQAMESRPRGDGGSSC